MGLLGGGDEARVRQRVARHQITRLGEDLQGELDAVLAALRDDQPTRVVGQAEASLPGRDARPLPLVAGLRLVLGGRLKGLRRGGETLEGVLKSLTAQRMRRRQAHSHVDHALVDRLPGTKTGGRFPEGLADIGTAAHPRIDPALAVGRGVGAGDGPDGDAQTIGQSALGR